MHWNNQSEPCTLAVPQGIYCETPMHHNMWTVEYTPIKDDAIATFSIDNNNTMSSFKARSSREPQPPLRLTGVQAHSIFGHLYPEAVKHVAKGVRGIELIDKNFEEVCEVCRLSDATQLISRVPREIEQSPFHELCWDIIFQKEAHGEETKLSYFYCPYLKFYFVFALFTTRQTEIISTFIYTLNYIELYYKIKVKVVSIDGETALTQGNAFTAFRDEKGFMVRLSTP